MGNIYKNSRVLNQSEYIEIVKKYNFLENELPLRLRDKNIYKDIDIFSNNVPNKITKDSVIQQDISIRSKIILPKNMKSFHILSIDNIQFDILPFIGREYTRIFYSFEFANVFFKKLTTKANKNCKCTSFGIIVSSKNINLEKYQHKLVFDNYTLVCDVLFLFDLIKLNIDEFYAGFDDRHALLKYFKSSEYYKLISFKYNSGFIRDLNSLDNLKLLEEENKLQFN
jgi:hypothetical protein